MKMVSMMLRLVVPVAVVVAALAGMTGLGSAASARQATPSTTGCEGMAPAASPMATMDHGGMDMGAGTPMAGMQMAVEFDQLYIDMMLPHHGGIIAMAQAALPLLQDERLRTIARGIIDTQTAEQAELRGYREQFFGSSDPAPRDDENIEAMAIAMPGMGAMDGMMFQMDAVAQVAAICAAPDVDNAFVDLTVPHHEMAIVASESAVAQAVHLEIAAFAQRVIDVQSAEITELLAIRAELTDGATPPA